MIERCCAHAAGSRRPHQARAEVLNDVELNQVLFRFATDDEQTQCSARCRTTVRPGWADDRDGPPGSASSVSNWQTDEDDVERTVAVLRRPAARAEACTGMHGRALVASALARRSAAQVERARHRAVPAGRRITASVRSTSSSLVCQFETEMRIAGGRPRSSPPIQDAPSSAPRGSTAFVSSSVANRNH